MTTRRIHLRTGATVALVHIGAWLLAVTLRDPLPEQYFRERGPSITRTAHGIQFDLQSSDPLLILAERPFDNHYVAESLAIWFGLLINLPAVLTAALTKDILAAALGLRASTWVGTAMFFVVSTAQWLFLGWSVATVAHRQRGRADHAQGGHP